MKTVSLRKASISFSKGGRNETSMRHNNRDLTDKEKKDKAHKNIDFSRTKNNKTLVKKDIKELYDELFGEALEEYNAKQKRKDRKIKNYYSKIYHDKKLDTQKEFVIQVGKKEDFQSNKIKNIWDISNEVLEKYVSSFEERNPNLKIYNAVIHNDESCPHVHLNVVPVASGYKNGLQKQPSFDKALRQQDGLKDSKSSFDLFESFRNQEVDYVAELLQEYSIDRELVGTNNIKNHHEYKELKEELEELDEEIEEKESALSDLETEVEDLSSAKVSLSTEVQELEEKKESLVQDVSQTHVDKIVSYNVPSVPKEKYAVISREDYLKLKEQNELVPQLVKQNKNLKEDNEDLSSANEWLLEENKNQSEQISQMQSLLTSARKQIERFVEGGADLWNRVMTYTSKFYPKAKEVLPADMQNEPSGERDYQEWRRMAAMHQRER